MLERVKHKWYKFGFHSNRIIEDTEASGKGNGGNGSAVSSFSKTDKNWTLKKTQMLTLTTFILSTLSMKLSLFKSKNVNSI